MSERSAFRVSCKAALYTPTGDKVLLSQYGPGDYGLPGGHMEIGETPEEAMERELYEELGVEGVQLRRRDFWMHHNGKVVLGFTGKIEEGTKLIIQTDELSGVIWASVDDIRSGAIAVRSYDAFICDFQPHINADV